VGSDYAEADISLKKAEEILGKPVYWQIPNDAKAMMSSRNAGVPLLQHAPKSKAQQSIAALATALCGKNGKSETKAGGFWPWKR
jgi:pilus assembly protein CpaE